MNRASIPVDLFNPGQVFACLGFLEAADVICSSASGGFDWADEANTHFLLETDGQRNPFELVLVFLANAEVRRIAPPGYKDPAPKKKAKKLRREHEGGGAQCQSDDLDCEDRFPGRDVDPNSLPVRLTRVGHSLDMTHWADGSSRDPFKLYAGNRSAAMIARNMIVGTRETKGIRTLWEEGPKALTERPFDVLVVMGGSFNFDARGAWTALGAGYSLNDQKHGVAASPVVELLAAIGLEHARPELVDRKVRLVRYGVWGELVPPSLARPLLAAADFGMALRKFVFTLDYSGKNRIVTFAEEEVSS